MRVLARAYGDRPLDRVTVGRDGSVVFIADPTVDKAVRNTIGEGVGFPAKFVFEFDAALYDSLRAAWASKDQMRLSALWGDAKPISMLEAL